MAAVTNGISALGKLLVVMALSVAFVAGLLGVVYIQLKGQEVEIPKIVGMNFNDGREDLADLGLRIKKIATRYSNEDPNTILEQRPRAGSVAKTGLMISVVVSEKNPDGSEAPVELKDDEEAIEEIEEQPELKIDKPRPASQRKKTAPKNRDVITKKPDAEAGADGADASADPAPDTAPPATVSTPTVLPKPPAAVPSPAPKLTPAAKPKPKKPKTGGDIRNRKVPEGQS